MRADEPEFFSVGAEVPHRLSQLGLVLFRLVGVDWFLLLLLVVVVVQQPLSHLLEVELQPLVVLVSLGVVVVLQLPQVVVVEAEWLRVVDDEAEVEQPPLVVVVELLLHVVDGEVVELLLVEEEEAPLPVNVKVWVQARVGAVVVQVPQPEHGPVASQQPQAAPTREHRRTLSLSERDKGVGQTTSKEQRTLMGLMSM